MSKPVINKENLRSLCMRKGLLIVELARKIGRSRQALYYAAENPRRFSETYKLMQKELR